jgi:hypothetical protein
MKELLIIAAVIIYILFCVINYYYAKKKFIAHYPVPYTKKYRNINLFTSLFSFLSLIINYLSFRAFKYKTNC